MICRAVAAPEKVAFEQEAERGLAMRIFLYSPKDMIVGALALAAVIAIITNALTQAGHHPAPMFGTVTTLPAVASVPVSPMPRPRPVGADTLLAEARPADLRAIDPLASLVKTTSTVQATSANIPRPPMTVPVSSRVDSVAVLGTGSHRGGCGATRVDRIWLWPVEAHRRGRRRHPGRDPEVRADAQASSHGPGLRSSGARTRCHDRSFDRVAAYRADWHSLLRLAYRLPSCD